MSCVSKAPTYFFRGLICYWLSDVEFSCAEMLYQQSCVLISYQLGPKFLLIWARGLLLLYLGCALSNVRNDVEPRLKMSRNP